MRNAAFQAARKSAKPAQYSKFRRLCNKVVKMIRNAKSSYFKNLNPRNKKQFWKAVKYLNKQQTTIPTLHHHGTAAVTDSEKASLLNECFSACFNRDTPPLLITDDDHHTVHSSSCSDELLCTAQEVIFLIMSLDPSKANGPDGISAQMLKGTAHSIAPSLTKLFNISISQGRFPECWKTSSVVPIPKSANHSEATDYRPISLLLVVSNLKSWSDIFTSMSPNISMNATHYPTNNGASSLASQQLQLSSLLLMIGFKHLKLDKKCVPSFLI